jgi:hypothetical protein
MLVRILAAAIVGVVALTGCTHDETVDRRSCEMLRDHLVDVRAADATDADAAQHRAAMKAALGDEFVDNCLHTMTVDQLECAMRASDLGATAGCAHTTTVSN